MLLATDAEGQRRARRTGVDPPEMNCRREGPTTAAEVDSGHEEPTTITESGQRAAGVKDPATATETNGGREEPATVEEPATAAEAGSVR